MCFCRSLLSLLSLSRTFLSLTFLSISLSLSLSLTLLSLNLSLLSLSLISLSLSLSLSSLSSLSLFLSFSRIRFWRPLSEQDKYMNQYCEVGDNDVSSRATGSGAGHRGKRGRGARTSMVWNDADEGIGRDKGSNESVCVLFLFLFLFLFLLLLSFTCVCVCLVYIVCVHIQLSLLYTHKGTRDFHTDFFSTFGECVNSFSLLFSRVSFFSLLLSLSLSSLSSSLFSLLLLFFFPTLLLYRYEVHNLDLLVSEVDEFVC